MSDQYRNGDAERRLENICRIGSVAEVDYANARVRIETGDLLTAWLPWITRRAGPDVDWWAPEVGEQVVVLSPGGVLEDGVVLGSIYQDSYAAPANTPNIHTTRYQDGTTITYDRSAHKLTISCVGDMDIECAGNFRVRASRIDLE